MPSLSSIAVLLVLCFVMVLNSASSYAAPPTYPTVVAPLVAKYCAACHTGSKPEGGFSFDDLGPDVGGKQAERWLRAAERMSLGEMPPSGEPRPAEAELRPAVVWLAAELHRAGKPVDVILRGPTGNHLDHDLLFSGNATAPLDNPPRLWRISPEIYAVWVLKHFNPKSAPGQALTAPGGSSFQDRAAEMTVDEGTLAVLLRNAQQTAVRSTRYRLLDGKIVTEPGATQHLATIVDLVVEPTREQLVKVISTFTQYRRYERVDDEEMKRLIALYYRATAAAGGDRASGLRAVLVAIQMHPSSLFRLELGLGSADAAGRRLLGPRELAYSLSFALGDVLDRRLIETANKGQLATREDVAREVAARLDDPKFAKPRILRFFQEYFAYTTAPDVFKDDAADNGHHGPTLVSDTDRLILHVLNQDRDVLRTLLTTNLSFVAAGGSPAKNEVTQLIPKVAIHKNYGLDVWPSEQPVALPESQRAGILTQPSWLVAMSGNFDNHPVQRGKWIRERLLGGTIPPVPITVNAQVPDDPTRSLRSRLDEVTHAQFCWQCHEKMNPLGLPFEQFDHFGRYRTAESVVDPTQPEIKVKSKMIPARRDLPLDTTGRLHLSGDANLEADVTDPLSLIRRLADSPRVRQVFIRHAFRYWMGRDENLGDSPTLIAADRAYVESNGSMKALILSLLTSDSFLLRTPPPEETSP